MTEIMWDLLASGDEENLLHVSSVLQSAFANGHQVNIMMWGCHSRKPAWVQVTPGNNRPGHYDA